LRLQADKCFERDIYCDSLRSIWYRNELAIRMTTSKDWLHLYILTLFARDNIRLDAATARYPSSFWSHSLWSDTVSKHSNDQQFCVSTLACSNVFIERIVKAIRKHSVRGNYRHSFNLWIFLRSMSGLHPFLAGKANFSIEHSANWLKLQSISSSFFFIEIFIV
jgi:hypothetical protein